MAVVIDNLELTPAPAPEKPAADKSQPKPPTPPAEAMEVALQRLEERQARVWAH
jgi:hypothetical protein